MKGVLVLGDQLSLSLSSLSQANRETDMVIMVEAMAETTYVPHHPKKIALVLSAMRHFARELEAEGWSLRYIPLDDPQNCHDVLEEAVKSARALGAEELLLTEPGEWRLRLAAKTLDFPVTLFADDRFITSEEEFARWADGRRELRMEYFYREMRRKTGLLMREGKPEGGKWNYDHDNRKKAQPDLLRPGHLSFEPDEITRDVLSLVEEKFGDNFGDLYPFDYAVTRQEALAAQKHFLDTHLVDFGTFQDAMLAEDAKLHHSLLSAYINLGLLEPLDLCKEVEARYTAGKVPLNSAEGFIRQIIGWREYMRGFYALHGPDYMGSNHLKHERALPALFWGRETKMACVGAAVKQTKELAYAHHIQRLMVTGNFALLAGLDPQEVHQWYLAVYFDAFEWVEAPNTIGMSQWADGGKIASKPYVSSGNYIHKMSNYCEGCAYKVTEKTGENACPFNLLYWHFLMRHKELFKNNPRMGQMYRVWERMDAEKRSIVLSQAETFLEKLDAGDVV